MKIVNKNTNLKDCTKCVYFICNIDSSKFYNIFTYNCSKFIIKENINPIVTYNPTIHIARNNSKLCGIEGKYFIDKSKI